MANPSVSIIVPVYNAERFIKRCVDSLLSQSHTALEVLLVDDGSTDKSLALCRAQAAVDPRVKVLSQKNAGPSAARNRGLEAATGDHLMFVDADDFASPDLVAELLAAAEAAGAGLAVCAYVSHLFAGGKQAATGAFPLKGGTLTVADFMSLATLDADDAQAVRGRAHIAGNIWGRLYSRKVVTDAGLRFNTDLMRYEDIQFNVSYLSRAEKIAIVDKGLYHYCVFTDHASLSDRMTKKNFAMALASYEAIRRELGSRRSDYLGYYFSYIVMGYLIRLFQTGSPFTFAEAVREVRSVCASRMYTEVMEFYRRPKGASVLVPSFLKVRMFLLASIAAKVRMLRASAGNRPVRQWCFAQS